MFSRMGCLPALTAKVPVAVVIIIATDGLLLLNMPVISGRTKRIISGSQQGVQRTYDSSFVVSSEKMTKACQGVQSK